MSKQKINRTSSFAEFVKELKSASSQERAIDIKQERRYFLIVCEGAKTEPNYFNYIRSLLPRGSMDMIEAIGIGDNTVNVVEEAIRLKKINQSNPVARKYDEVWAVFDRDSFPKARVNAAVHLAQRNGIEHGLSNEAFELWYILHFECLQSRLTREQYFNKMRLILGRYEKREKDIYTRLIQQGGKTDVAIRNARLLETMCAGSSPASSKPYTRVYVLVERLRKLVEF